MIARFHMIQRGAYTMPNTIETRADVLAVIYALAQSQGSYGRLLRALYEADEVEADCWLDEMAEMCDTPLDLVLFLEG